jgi:microcystin-dependent protein
MSEPFVAEIRMFGFSFAPRGWAFCDGQIMPIAQNTALFSLLGTNYGGNGTSNFGLPNLQASVPIGVGQGPGLSQYVVGQTGGEANVTLIANELPVHSHAFECSTTTADQTSPVGMLAAPPAGTRGQNFFASGPGTGASMNAQAVLPAGGNQPHNNLPPYLKLNFCIALQGVFPSRP